MRPIRPTDASLLDELFEIEQWGDRSEYASQAGMMPLRWDIQGA